MKERETKLENRLIEILRSFRLLDSRPQTMRLLFFVFCDL